MDNAITASIACEIDFMAEKGLCTTTAASERESLDFSIRSTDVPVRQIIVVVHEL